MPVSRWIPVAAIASWPGLKPDDRIRLLAVSISELGICQGLVIIHGPERGYAHYLNTGGQCRIDPLGNPEILLNAIPRNLAEQPLFDEKEIPG